MGHLKVGDNLDKEKPEADKGNVFKDDVLNRLNVREPDVYYVNTKIKKCRPQYGHSRVAMQCRRSCQ